MLDAFWVFTSETTSTQLKTTPCFKPWIMFRLTYSIKRPPPPKNIPIESQTCCANLHCSWTRVYLHWFITIITVLPLGPSWPRLRSPPAAPRSKARATLARKDPPAEDVSGHMAFYVYIYNYIYIYMYIYIYICMLYNYILHIYNV